MKDPSHKLSGGRVSRKTESEYHALRRLLKAEPDVHDVIELAKDAAGHWLYLIRTPLDWVFPRFVIGSTDALNEAPEILLRCSAEWSARAEWDRLTLQPPAPAES